MNREYRVLWLVCLLLAPVWSAVSPLLAADDAKEPEVISLTTKDGVGLKVTYYASSLGKQATPVILLADRKDSRSVYDNLAKRLQSPGKDDNHKSFAVLAVDLRGHGDSTKQSLPNGQTRQIDASKLGRKEVAAIVQFDMAAIRRFLVKKNDAGNLNLNRLSIVGAGLGASVAVNWAAIDWSFPPLAVGKQGQDVKALVLVSPKWTYQGLQLNQALRQPGVQQEIAFLIMYGKRDRRLVTDAKRIKKQLERYHPEPENPEPEKPNSLTFLTPDVGLQGTQFLTEAGRDAEDQIIQFLSFHVTDKDLEWTSRKHH